MSKENNFKKVYALILGLCITTNSYAQSSQCDVRKAELKEIDTRQKEILNDKDQSNSKNLEQLLSEIDKYNAERVGMLGLMRLKDDYNKSRSELEKLSASEFLSSNAITFLNDLSTHVKSVAHHNLIVNTMNALTPNPDTKESMSEEETILGMATNQKEKNAGSVRQFFQKIGYEQKSLFEYMKNCNTSTETKSVHCEQFTKNIARLGEIGNKFGDPSFVATSKEVIDNYGKLLSLSLNTQNTSKEENENQFYEAISKHKSILRDVDLLGGADIFGLNRNENDINDKELEKVDRLLEYFESIHSNKTTKGAVSNKIEFQLDSKLNRDRKSLVESVEIIRGSLQNIKSKCDILCR